MDGVSEATTKEGAEPLPSGPLPLLYNHRIRQLHRLGLKKVQRFNVFQIRHDRVLGFNHIACSSSPQHCLNIARIVRKIDARSALSYQSITGQIGVYWATGTVLGIQTIIVHAKRECLFQLIIPLL